jgi:MtrB/PioB family decaheme-associated outer membrane protein
MSEEGQVRNSWLLTTIAIALIPVATTAQVPATPSAIGRIDFGVRGTATTGDAARYERYRDMGDGLFMQRIQLGREVNRWVLDFSGHNVGRSDQRFAGDFVRPGKFKGWVMWDQIPMLLSRTTRTLFVEDLEGPQSVLTIPDTIQAQAQLAPSSMERLFDDNSIQFETSSRRHIGQGGFEYLATPEFTVHTRFQYTDRQGNLPYGGSFGHSSLVEFPAPIDHRLTDFEAGAEFSRDRLLLRAGYSGSFFENRSTTATFDNPFRAVDIATASSRGRVSLAPNNTFFSVNGMASVRLPQRSRLTAYVSVGSLTDAGDPLMPQTINSAVTAAPVDRNVVGGEARTLGLNLSYVSRPTRNTDINVQFRKYDYDNRTPHFNMIQRIAYDNAPSAVSPAVPTEPFGVLRNTFDADFKFLPRGGTTAGVGFSRLQEERSFRIFESTTDNVFRLIFDSVGNRWVTLRTKYEHAQRRGKGIEHGEAELRAIGEQPGLRHFDVAPRDRDRVTIVASVSPVPTMSWWGSVAAGKDDYRLELPGTSTTPESLFGLRDNSHRVYALGLDAMPGNLVTLGGSYSYEHYNALSRSRQANPGAQFSDPTRNWAADGTDRVHSVVLTAGLNEIADRIQIDFGFDYNRSRALYEYVTGTVVNRTLPEEVVIPSTLPPPTALPLVKSDLARGTVDVVYSLTSRVGIGVSYWYEQYWVEDFTLDVEANPELARGQTLLMGYLYTPYTANTLWGRLIYRW